MNKSFGSDNHSGIAPLILQAIWQANIGHTPAYGDDPYTEQAKADFNHLFGRMVDVWFVFNGTGANVLSLGAGASSFNSIICVKTAHINVDECGAPEKNLGSKVIAVDGVDGKLTIEAAQSEMHDFGFCHHSQPKFLSITQSTELGTLYTVQEIDQLADLAHSAGMYLHVDGARIANAVAASGVSIDRMMANVDVLSFGGTKNGMMMGEAVVVFNPELGKHLDYQRKQSMQLCSKMRFIAAQFSAYLKDDLWLKLASQANERAQELAGKIEPYLTITRPPQVNAVFAIMPESICEQLQSEFHFYIWDESTSEARFVCSFDTTSADIDIFVNRIKQLTQ